MIINWNLNIDKWFHAWKVLTFPTFILHETKLLFYRFYHLFVHVIYKLKKKTQTNSKSGLLQKIRRHAVCSHGINVSIFNLYSQFHFFQLKTRLINDDMHNKICILLFKSKKSSRLIYDILSKYGKVSYVKMFIQVLWLCYKLYKCAKTWYLFVLRLKQTN